MLRSVCRRATARGLVAPTTATTATTATTTAVVSGPAAVCFPSRRGYASKDPVPRNPNYGEVTEEHVEALRKVCSRVETDPSVLEGHNKDWTSRFVGASRLLLKPKSTDEVSAILAYCNTHKLAVVPQGGNTGLVGGSIPLHDEIVLSTQNLTKIRSFDESSGVLVAEAGGILESLDNYVREKGFIMPLDLGAKGSCHIGGNVSTNAGGIRYLRYGSLHGSVLGIEAVLADGTVIDTLSTLRKDNTGYDLKQLFIGSEGTLGVVTAVSIQTPPQPLATNVAFLACESFEDVVRTFGMARSSLAEVLSACEFQDSVAADFVFRQIPGATNPLSEPAPFYMLIETSGSNHDHDMEKLDNFLSEVMAEGGPVVDGTLAQDGTQMKELWKLRESIAVAFVESGPVYKYDLSVPISSMYSLVEGVRGRLADTDCETAGYGHIGDGNVHINVAAPKYSREVEDLLEPYLFEEVAKLGGSISAEHGLGQQKNHVIHYSKAAPAVELMKKLKDVFDPNGILNPYKVLP